MPGSVTRVRLELMHWTGMRPSQMGRLQADDFRLDEPIPYVAVPRGKGGRLAAVPLVPEGVAAARAFLDANAFGPWPRSSVNRGLAAAARRAGRPPFTAYQIRHSFAARPRPAGTDVADIQDLYGHTRPETTMIYAPPELPKHLAALDGHTGEADADSGRSGFQIRRQIQAPQRTVHQRPDPAISGGLANAAATPSKTPAAARRTPASATARSQSAPRSAATQTRRRRCSSRDNSAGTAVKALLGPSR